MSNHRFATGLTTLMLIFMMPGVQAQAFAADFAPSEGLGDGGTRFISGAMQAQNPAVEGGQLYTGLSGFSITGLDRVCDLDGSQGVPECFEGRLRIAVDDGGGVLLNFWEPVAVDLGADHAFTLFADAAAMAGGGDGLPVALTNSSFSLMTGGTVQVHDIPTIPDPVATGVQGGNDTADAGDDGNSTSDDGNNTDDSDGNQTGGGDGNGTDGGDGGDPGSDPTADIPAIEEFGLLMSFSSTTRIHILDDDGPVTSVQGDERRFGFQGDPVITPFGAGLAGVPLGAGSSYAYTAAEDGAAAEGISLDRLFNAFGDLDGDGAGADEEGPGDGLGDVEPLMNALLNGAVLSIPGEGGSSDDFMLVRFSDLAVTHDGRSLHWQGDAPLQVQGTTVQGAPSTILLMPTWTWVLWLVAMGVFIARLVVKPHQGRTVVEDVEVPVTGAASGPTDEKTDPAMQEASRAKAAVEDGAQTDLSATGGPDGPDDGRATTDAPRTETVTHTEQVPPPLEEYRWVGRITAPIALLVMFWVWDTQVHALLGVSMMDADLSTTGFLLLSLIQLGSLALVFTAIAWPLGIIGRNGLLLARQGRVPGPYTVAILVSAFLGTSILLGFLDNLIAGVADRLGQGA